MNTNPSKFSPVVRRRTSATLSVNFVLALLALTLPAVAESFRFARLSDPHAGSETAVQVRESISRSEDWRRDHVRAMNDFLNAFAAAPGRPEKY